MISISFDRGSAEPVKGHPLEYSWQTPDEDGNVRITASFGPLAKTFDVKVVQTPEALQLDLAARSERFYKFRVDGKVTNSANIAIDGLRFSLVTENLDLESSSFPEDVGPKRSKSVRAVCKLALPDDLQPVWSGYTIPQSLKLNLDYNGNHLEKEFTNSVEIQPNEGFYVKILDKNTGFLVPFNELAMEAFEVFDEQGHDITSSLTITRAATLLKVKGIAPGFPGKPLKLKVRYILTEAEVELAYESIEKLPGFVYPTVTLNAVVTPTLTVKALADGDPVEEMHVEITKPDDTGFSALEQTTSAEGTCSFPEVEPGRYIVRLTRSEFIPHQQEVTMLLGKNTTAEINVEPYIAVLFRGKAYYESMFDDVKSVAVEKSVGMTAVSSHIFILPEDCSKLYFNLLYKIGRPDTYTAWAMGEDRYNISFSLYRVSTSGADTLVYSTSPSRSEGFSEFREEDIYQDESRVGQFCDATTITAPTRFRADVSIMGGDTKEVIIWVFPSNWQDYAVEAKKVAILYGLKGNLDIFDYGTDAQSYLRDRVNFGNLLASGLNPIISYGSQSLEIFGSVPDDILEAVISEGIDAFVDEAISRVLQKLVGELGEAVVGEMLDLYSSLLSAAEWAGRMPAVVQTSVDAVNENALLAGIADDDVNFTQALAIFDTLKGRVSGLIDAIEDNDPAASRLYLNEIKTISVGDHPDSQNPQDHVIDYSTDRFTITQKGSSAYTLAVVLGLEYSRIDEWSSGNSTAQYFNDNAGLIPNSQKRSATKAAMKTYKPIWQNIMRISAIFIDVSLIDE